LSYFFRRKLVYRLDEHRRTVLAIYFAFMVYMFFCNVVWSILEQDTSFLISLVFWVFSFLLMATLLIAQDDLGLDVALRRSAFLGVVILLIFWALGLGRYNYGFRYNGYFNDPNQMAFWVLCASAVYFYLSDRKNRYLVLLLSLTALFVIFTTSSRSALLGAVFIMLAASLRFMGVGAGFALGNKIVYTCLAVCLIPVAAYLILGTEAAVGLFDRFANTNFGEQAELRGYTRILNYPEYLLFGAGQGLDSRFDSVHEVHSSWVAVLFYYGLIGAGLFLYLLMKTFLKLDMAGKLVFIAPIMYGISTYGLRTPIFWFFLASAVSYARRPNSHVKL